MEYENAIEIKDLTKRYDGFTLDHVSFHVPRGSIMGFIGQNGAGKTTTINSILNLIKKDEGKIRIFGLDYEVHEIEYRRHLLLYFDFMDFVIQTKDPDLALVLFDKV